MTLMVLDYQVFTTFRLGKAKKKKKINKYRKQINVKRQEMVKKYNTVQREERAIENKVRVM